MSSFTWHDQQLAIFDHGERNLGSLNVIARAGTGKCLGLGTPVMLSDGSVVPVETIKRGDKLMGPDSVPRKVLSTNKGSGPLYRINPIKGMPWVCNDAHVMTLVGSNHHSGEIIDAPLADFLSKQKTVRADKEWKLFRVPVSFAEQEVPYDPYVIGCWLGDGTFAGPMFTLGYGKVEVLEYLKDAAATCGCIAKVRDDKKDNSWNVRYSIRNRKGKSEATSHDFWQYIQGNCQDGQSRRIPDEYLKNSKGVRGAMLAGLLDTDGYLNSGVFYITTKHEQLRDNILFLARSLGMAAYSAVKNVRLEGWKESRPYQAITIFGDFTELPFCRHKVGPRKQIKNVLRSGWDATPIGNGDYYGFTLDGDGRFLLGDFTVTHNTTTLVELARRVKGRVFLGAFNKSIADELAARVQSNPRCTASTFHSIGFKLWKEMRCRAQVDSRKVPTLARELYPWDKKVRELIVDAVGFAKLDGIGLNGMPEYGDVAAWREMFDEHDMWDDVPAGISEGRVLDDCIRVFKKSLDMCESQANSVIDFNDMLYAPLYFGAWKPQRFDWVMMDEAQDTNETRLRLAQSILVTGGSFVAVGDPCQPAGTKVAVVIEKGTQHYQECIKHTPIEKIKVGDMVVSYNQSDCAFIKGRRVEGVTRRKYAGYLRVVSLFSGHQSKYTENHHCLVNFTKLRSKYAVYVMCKGSKFRVGMCKMDYGTGRGCGVRSRLNAENADQAWVLSVHDSRREAYHAENYVSANFGLPQLMFTVKNNSQLTQDDLDHIWSVIHDNKERAETALQHFGREINYPLFSRQNWKESMKRPIVTYASNIMKGCLMLPYRENTSHAKASDWVEVETIKTQAHVGDVFSLTVAGEHLYCADGIITHNCQAIYQFAGAKLGAMDHIKDSTGAKELPLTMTYRCPKLVVAMAQEHVPDYTAAEGNGTGVIESTDHRGLWQLANTLTPKDVILCRNTRPLVGIAKRLRADHGVPCIVEGNMGKAILSLLSKWGDDMTWGQYTTRLDQYKTTQVGKLLGKVSNDLEDYDDTDLTIEQKLARSKKEEQADYIIDKVKTIYDIADDPMPDTPLKDVIARAERLFGKGQENSEVLRLCTVHRCVHPDTLVETTNGLQRIRDIKDTGCIATPDGASPYKGKFTKELGPTILFTTRRGYSIEVSPEHGMTVWNGVEHVRIEAKDIVAGDWLRLRLGETIHQYGLQQLPEAPECRRGTVVFPLPKSVTLDMAEFLGLMVADGTVYPRGFRLVKRYQSVVDRFKELCVSLFDCGFDAEGTNYEGTPAASISSTYISRWLLSIGGLSPNKKYIPDVILRSSLDVQSRFLRGLFEDGTVNIKNGYVDHIHWENVSYTVAGVVQTMLLRFGISSTRRFHHGITTLYIYSQSAKKFSEVIGFVSTEKNEKLKSEYGRDIHSLIPLTKSEANLCSPYMSKADLYNARSRGYISITVANDILSQCELLPYTFDWLKDRTGFVYQRVVSHQAGESETVCVEVPVVSRFLQNGFDGWNSKGREWDRVILIGKNRYMPSYFAKTDEDLKAEANVEYVAITRTKRVLVLVSVPVPGKDGYPVKEEQDWWEL